MTNVVLISNYELGRQPFGLASPAAWLRDAGANVRCLDLAVEPADLAALRQADVVGFYVPMHMGTRMAAPIIPQVKKLNPQAHLVCFGLYAPMNEEYLRSLGVHTVLGGEFETGLLSVVRRVQNGTAAGPQPEPVVSLARQDFRVPDRGTLPGLEKYAQLMVEPGQTRLVGYTEASRGCKHVCRHCPVVPVYGGRFRVVPQPVVLADIRQQVVAGAQHITFGDPDFFNGPGHALPLVEALHREFPRLTYDVTIKVEHLRRRAGKLPILKKTGCLFITTAVESFDPQILEIFDKQHTRDDFETVVHRCRNIGLHLAPTFVPFTPWTTLEGYRHFLQEIVRLDLVDQVSPIQFAIRLLIPPGSKLLDLPDVQSRIGPLDQAKLSYTWHNPDPRLDALQADLEVLVQRAASRNTPRRETFRQIWSRTFAKMGDDAGQVPPPEFSPNPRFVPYLTEPWYC